MQKLQKQTFLRLVEEQPYLLESLYCFDFSSHEKPVLTRTFQPSYGPYRVLQLKAVQPTRVDVTTDDMETVLSQLRKEQRLQTAKTYSEVWDTFACEDEVYTGTVAELKTMLETLTVNEEPVLYPTVLVVPSYSEAKRQWLQRRLCEYQNVLTNQGYQVLGLFLYGSQNYQMDTLASDVDAVAVVLPTAVEHTFDLPMEKTVEMEYGSVRVKDVRQFARQLLKGNYSTLEWLLTPYRTLHGNYFTDLLKPEMVYDLLNFNMRQTLAATFGSYGNMKSYEHKDGKSLARMAHLLRFQSHLLNAQEQTFTLDDWRFALTGNRHFGQVHTASSTDPVMYTLQQLKLESNKSDNDLSQEFETLYAKERELHQKFQTKYPRNTDNELTPYQKAVKEQLAKWVEKVFLLSVLERRSASAVADALLND